jgi:hypothetical protein
VGGLGSEGPESFEAISNRAPSFDGLSATLVFPEGKPFKEGWPPFLLLMEENALEAMLSSRFESTQKPAPAVSWPVSEARMLPGLHSCRRQGSKSGDRTLDWRGMTGRWIPSYQGTGRTPWGKPK